MKKLNLHVSIYDMACKISEARHRQKSGYKTSNPMSDNYELVGVLGEFIYGYMTNELPDNRLVSDGDCGFDFSKKVQVKSSEEYKARHLIEYIDKDFSKFDVYVFVIVNLSDMVGYIKGWIYVDDFKRMAKIRDFGYGDRYYIHLNQLNPSWI